MSSQWTDEALMQAVRDGDVDRLSVLFDRYHRRLFDFFCRMNGNAMASEDLAQEVFLRMLKYRHSYRDGHVFLKWMYQIARNARLRRFTTEKDRPDAAEELHRRSSTEGRPDHELMHNEKRDLLEQALLRLPDEKRELLVLATYQETPYETIADWLEIDVNAVKVRVHRAMKELRQTLLKMSGEKTSCDAKKSSIGSQTA